MKYRMLLPVLCVAIALMAPAAQGAKEPIVVWHDPWLNWDFVNNLPAATVVNDFAIVVDAANWVPQQQWAVPFPNFQTLPWDWDGDGILDDTMCKWWGAVIAPGTPAHGGLYMPGSGMVLDAFWTSNCQKVGPSTAITYERTKIIFDDPEVHMGLMIAPGYFEDTENPNYPNAEAGWTNIRTFVNIPASLLGLEDLTRDLDLDWLATQPGVLEVPPKRWDEGLNQWVEIPPTDIIGYKYVQGQGVPESFFDVFLSEIEPQYAGPDFEALLHAQVVNQGTVVGEFWNLNPQSPEPATLGLLLIGGLATLLRRKR